MARRPAKSAAASPSYGIRQEELAEYRAYHDEQKRLASELETRKRSLMQRLEAGEQVEPGSLTAGIAAREVRLFTADQVARIMGAEIVAEIRTQLLPSVQRSLQVIPTA